MNGRSWLVTGVAVLVGPIVATGLSASTATTQGAVDGSRSTDASLRSTPCPKHAMRLPSDGVARTAEQALDEAAALYSGIDTHRAKAQAADRSGYAGVRGKEVRQMCGVKVARRTVVVQLLFPKMLPSASLSQGTVFVSRLPHGYRVWEVAH